MGVAGMAHIRHTSNKEHCLDLFRMLCLGTGTTGSRQSWKASSQLQVKNVLWNSYVIRVLQWQLADMPWLVNADLCTNSL